MFQKFKACDMDIACYCLQTNDDFNKIRKNV